VISRKHGNFTFIFLIKKTKTYTNMAKIKWVLDPAHSEVRFRIRHMMISQVTGQFNKFEADVETEDEDFTTAKIRFTADLDSITTNNEQRDAHLKSGDFFDIASYPQVVFEGKKLEKVNGDYKLHGTISIRGVDKDLVLDAEYGGSARDPWGNTRVGFSVTGKINRKDFGLTYNTALETGGVLIGDEVKIDAHVEFIRQEA
jgi:polyisoprenoid-binding protein YceI